MPSQFPPRIPADIAQGVKPGVLGRNDPARLVISKARYIQPKLEMPGGTPSFTWPGGTEGITIAGSASVAEHRYIGDNKLLVEITHRDARRITLSGMFTGATAAHNVQQLLDVILAIQPKNGKLLTVPGVFVKQQRVAVENYEFAHPEDNRDDSFNYTLTLIDFGTGAKIPQIKQIISRISLNPRSATVVDDRGKTQRTFVVHSGARTLRSIAKIVYGNSNRWNDIFKKNTKVLYSLHVQHSKLPTKQLPIGLRLKY